MERRLDKLEVVYQARNDGPPRRRVDFSMLSDDELEELAAMAEALEPSILNPSGEDALTFAQKARLVELAAKVEGGQPQ